MVTQYGMSSKLGAVKYGTSGDEPFLGRTMGHERDYSDSVAAEIDAEVRALIELAHDEAWEILVEYRDVLDNIVLELMEKETISQADMARHLRPGASSARRWRRSTASASASPSDRAAGAHPGREGQAQGAGRGRRRAGAVGGGAVEQLGRHALSTDPTASSDTGSWPSPRPSPTTTTSWTTSPPGWSTASSPARPVEDAVDLGRIEKAVREILIAIGEDPDRDGLQQTPARVARAYAELFAGLRVDPAQVLTTTFEANHEELVLVRDIERDEPAASTTCCRSTGVAHIGYIPGADGRITGLSKLARLVEVYARRPQVQERLTSQIADLLMEQARRRAASSWCSSASTCAWRCAASGRPAPGPSPPPCAASSSPTRRPAPRRWR